MFSYKKFAILCAKRGIFPSTVAMQAGLSKAACTGWKNGKQPRKAVLPVLAEILGCSVDDFFDKKSPASNEAGSDIRDQITDFFFQLPPEKLRGILLALGAPKELLDALDRQAPQK